MSDYRDEASGRFVYTHVLSHIIRKGLSMRRAAHREGTPTLEDKIPQLKALSECTMNK